MPVESRESEETIQCPFSRVRGDLVDGDMASTSDLPFLATLESAKRGPANIKAVYDCSTTETIIEEIL
jgi:hypothetical protein